VVAGIKNRLRRFSGIEYKLAPLLESPPMSCDRADLSL